MFDDRRYNSEMKYLLKLFNFFRLLEVLSLRGVFVITFFILILFYCIHFLICRKLPLGHDTLQYLQLQYSFLNELAMKGELPLWFPFMTKGTVTNLWFLLQNGLLNNLYYPLATFLNTTNYYYLFYISLFFDEFVLLVGLLLLS